MFEPGDVTVPFFVLLSGALEIVQPTVKGERLIVTHQAGSFTGEMTMISGRGALVRGRVTAAGEFLELSPEELRTLVARDAELSEIFMRAFILRRVLLLSSGSGNVILLGSRHSAKTLHLREFLTRNGHPHTYVDLDTDTGAQELLDRFAVTSGRNSGGDLQRRNRAAWTVDPGIGKMPGAQRAHHGCGSAGSGNRRRRPGGAGCGRLWRIGRPGRFSDRGRVSRRAGGIELEDRKLSGLSHGNLRETNWRAVRLRRRRSLAPRCWSPTA